MRISDWSSDVCSSDLRDDECAKTAAASPHARRQNAFNRPARQGRTAIIDDHARADDKALRRVVGTVALLNLAYFGVEFAVALRIGSVSLFADSVDFLEDASVNLLILLALGWTVRSRDRLRIPLAVIGRACCRESG